MNSDLPDVRALNPKPNVKHRVARVAGVAGESRVAFGGELRRSGVGTDGEKLGRRTTRLEQMDV